MSCKQCRNVLNDSDKSMKCDLGEAVFSHSMHWNFSNKLRCNIEIKKICIGSAIHATMIKLRNFKSVIFNKLLACDVEALCVTIIREEREIEKRNASLVLFNFPK